MLRTGDQPNVLPASKLFEGRTLGGYRIARAIASGGMATVFLARRKGPGRFAQTAALKVIHPHLAQEREFVEMFLEEARLASAINHPNVCRVLDFGHAEGTYYLAMEYVRGETWASALEALTACRESRSRLHALSSYVIAQACEGLHAVHGAVDPNGVPLQIVHRDISPHNLLIAYDGSVRVMDFGVASARANDSGLAASTTQLIKGRYAYMAPEQVRGAEVDLRADIWSLGVCLREALSQTRLFERETQIATILAVTQEAMPAWPSHVPLLLREICDRALEREPTARFDSARDFGRALAHVSSGQTAPGSGDELARFMRLLFADRLAQMRAELSELAGDEGNSGTFTSIVAPSGVRSTGAQERALSPSTRPVSGVRLWGGAVTVASVAAALAFYLTPAARTQPPATLTLGEASSQDLRSDAARAARPEARAGRLEANPSVALAALDVAPSEPHAIPGQARLPGASAEAAGLAETFSRQRAVWSGEHPAADLAPAAAATGDETAREKRHRLRRERAEARGRAAAAANVEQDATGRADVRGTTRGPDTEVASPGILVVGASAGWAEIRVAGRLLGTTPLRQPLPPGAHEVDVRFFGTSSPRLLRVEVKSGDTVKLRLEP